MILLQDQIPTWEGYLNRSVEFGVSRVYWGLYAGVLEPYDDSLDFPEGVYGLTDNSTIYQETLT